MTAQVFRHSEAPFTTADMTQEPFMGPSMSPEGWPRDAKTCAHSEHLNGVVIGGSRIPRDWETWTGSGSSFDTGSLNEIPTGTSPKWEVLGSEVAEYDGKSDTGQSKSTTSLDAEDDEHSAVDGVDLSATADCSKLGSEEQAL